MHSSMQCTSKCGSPAAEVLACDGSHSGDVISAVFVCPFLIISCFYPLLWSIEYKYSISLLTRIHRAPSTIVKAYSSSRLRVHTASQCKSPVPGRVIRQLN